MAPILSHKWPPKSLANPHFHLEKKPRERRGLAMDPAHLLALPAEGTLEYPWKEIICPKPLNDR